MNKEKDVIDLKDFSPCSTWSPTMKLRWKMTEIKLDFYDSHCKPELQQLWTDGLGKEEWRPIEFVK